MLSRATVFRRATERSGAKKSPKPNKKLIRRGAAVDAKGIRHEAKRIDEHHNATYALEDSATKPSRLTTRKSSNRQKTDVQYRLKDRSWEAQVGEHRSRGK